MPGADARTGEPAGAAELSPQFLQEAAARFGLLASTMRLHILWVLAHGEMDVGGLAEAVGGSIQAVSQQLAKLRLAGLVRSRREGRRQVYIADDPQLVTILQLAIEQLAAAPASATPRSAPPARKS
jgi:DNA-binding transcriptional ArsR family regulator